MAAKGPQLFQPVAKFQVVAQRQRMKPYEFFAFASKLFVSHPPSAPCSRTIISRAYYGAYHAARQLLDDLGIRSKSGISEHLYLQRLFKESQVEEAIELGQLLDNLHQSRKDADYDLGSDQPEKRGQVQACLERAVEAISRVTALSSDEALRRSVRDGITEYKNKVGDLP
jgi:uncharacterized protein (UPF0332 family)